MEDSRITCATFALSFCNCRRWKIKLASLWLEDVTFLSRLFINLDLNVIQRQSWREIFINSEQNFPKYFHSRARENKVHWTLKLSKMKFLSRERSFCRWILETKNKFTEIFERKLSALWKIVFHNFHAQHRKTKFSKQTKLWQIKAKEGTALISVKTSTQGFLLRAKM